MWMASAVPLDKRTAETGSAVLGIARIGKFVFSITDQDCWNKGFGENIVMHVLGAVASLLKRIGFWFEIIMNYPRSLLTSLLVFTICMISVPVLCVRAHTLLQLESRHTVYHLGIPSSVVC